MTPAELLADLRNRGVKLWAEGADLRFSARKGTLSGATTQLLTRHKAELLNILNATSGVSAAPSALALNHAFSLEDDAIPLGSVEDWHPEEQSPYVRRVAPYKGFLYQRLGLNKTFVRGEGCYLFDAAGVRYADFIAQYGAVPFGHDPEPIWQALDAIRQERRPNLAFVSMQETAGELAERLLALAPRGLDYATFANSGAEALEAAFKLARSRTQRHGILSTRDGFHGLTLGSMSATGRQFFQRGFGAPVGGFNYVPFGDLDALRAVLELRPDYFAAFVVEIIQGESGIQVAPPGYIAAAMDLCHRFGVLFIVDEVQTGLGRTGALFACETEGVTPDILTLAKALGGGLIPIGAVLYAGSVYNEHFEFRHGSTFAGNTLACCAAMATLDQLTRDNHALVRHVAQTGHYLQEQLLHLKNQHAPWIADVRGRGLMLGVEFAFDHIAETQAGMLAMMKEQGLLMFAAVSYLLNVEHIRVSPAFSGTVMRIEPPLTADNLLCDHLVAALLRLLDILHRGDAGALIGHLLQGPGVPPPPRRRRPRGRATEILQAAAEPARTKFAFVIHPLATDDMRRVDVTLERFSDEQLDGFRTRMRPFVRPFPLDRIAVAAGGRAADGELIVLPHLPAEMLALSGHDAAEMVQSAVDMAAARGAKVIGLAGFCSIVAGGGLALRAPRGVLVTSGNSLTTWAAIRSMEMACARRGMALAGRTVAVVGATGAIGRALSLLCAARGASLILIGNPRASNGSLDRLKDVAQECRREAQQHTLVGTSTLHATALLANGSPPDGNARVTITTDLGTHLPDADVVFIATNAVEPFIAAHHLRQGALVCDVSRPVNLPSGLLDERPDLHLVGGGLVRAPDAAVLGHIEEPEQPNVLVACAAETIVLALARLQSKHLCGPLDVAAIQTIGHTAEQLGFAIVE
ncbi:MAG: aminotransferase class III-fold pyridoxal phosphate-dependent enzyme [Xanthobacteraceae bacterium]